MAQALAETQASVDKVRVSDYIGFWSRFIGIKKRPFLNTERAIDSEKSISTI